MVYPALWMRTYYLRACYVTDAMPAFESATYRAGEVYADQIETCRIASQYQSPACSNCTFTKKGKLPTLDQRMDQRGVTNCAASVRQELGLPKWATNDWIFKVFSAPHRAPCL